MKLQPGKKISALFGVLEGKHGPKAAVWAWMSVAAVAGAIGVGAAFFVCGWPFSAAFFAASLLQTSISSATNASGSVSNHKHFLEITERSRKNLEKEQEYSKIENRLVALIEAQQGKPPEQAKAPDPDPGNPALQSTPEKGLSALFNSLFHNVLGGKRGPRAKAWARLSIAVEAAAIGLGVTVAVGAWPLTTPLAAAFYAASLATNGIGDAGNAASSASNHRHFEEITEIEKRAEIAQQNHLERVKGLVAQLEAKPPKPQTAPAPGPR